MSQHIPGTRLDRSHIAPVTTREELIYLLSRAAELEHSLACIYLFASYSLKNDVSEGGMTNEQAAMVRDWRRHLNSTAVEEMGHLATGKSCHEVALTTNHSDRAPGGNGRPAGSGLPVCTT